MATQLAINAQKSHGEHRDALVAAPNLFLPQPMSGSAAPIAWDRMELSSNQTAAMGQTIVFDLPTAGMIGEMYLETTLAAPTSSGNYTQYVGLCIPERIEILNGSKVLHDYDYVTAMRMCMSELPDNQVATILRAAGGTGLNAGTVCSPIPTFWSRLLHHGNRSRPLLAAKLNGKLQVRVTMRAAADILDASASATDFTSAQLVYFEMSTDDSTFESMVNEPYVYKSVDIETNILNVVATATATDIDLSGERHDVVSLTAFLTLVSNYTTAHDYLVNLAPTAVKLTLDGRSVCDYSGALQIDFDSAFVLGEKNMHAGLDSVQPFRANWALAAEGAEGGNQHQIGSLPLQAVNKTVLTITHAAGANAYCDVAFKVHRTYSINARGLIERSG